MADEEPVRSGEAHDRLTRLCAAMTDALVAHPEATGTEQAVVFLQDGSRGGLVMHGYVDDAEAIADVIWHLKAIFRSNGKTLMFGPIGKG